MKAKKSLGQHFLTDKNALAQIRDAIDPMVNDIVVEVGPGMGVLTRILLAFVRKVIAIEKDPRMVEHLKKEFAKDISTGKLEVLEEDILLFDFKILEFYHEGYKLVGNIPYYLTGALLRKIFESKKLPKKVVFLIQKEVAERIVGIDAKESILSLAIKAYGNPSISAHVPREAFDPAPNVDSAVLRIEDIHRNNFENLQLEKRFFEILHAGFLHKRKYLIRNLESIAEKENLTQLFRKLALSPLTRAEDVSLTKWLALTTTLVEHHSI